MIPQDAGVIIMLSFLVVTLIHLVKALDTNLEVNRPNEGGTQHGAHSQGTRKDCPGLGY